MCDSEHEVQVGDRLIDCEHCGAETSNERYCDACLDLLCICDWCGQEYWADESPSYLYCADCDDERARGDAVYRADFGWRPL